MERVYLVWGVCQDGVKTVLKVFTDKTKCQDYVKMITSPIRMVDSYTEEEYLGYCPAKILGIDIEEREA